MHPDDESRDEPLTDAQRANERSLERESSLASVARALLLTREVSIPMTATGARACGWDDISNTTVVVLCKLADAGTMRPRELLGPTGLSSGGLSNLLGRLERNGLVARASLVGPDDGRAVAVTLTDQGRQFEQRMSAGMFSGLRSSEGAIKELIVTLVEAGAVPVDLEASPASSKERTVALACGLLGIELAEALELTMVEGATDVNVALVLAALAADGGCRPRRVAQLLSISSGGASRLIDRLENAGLVERSVDELADDHRGVIVRLTPSGQRQIGRLAAGLRDNLGRLLSIVRVVAQERHSDGQ